VDDGIVNFCLRKRGGEEIEQSRAEQNQEQRTKQSQRLNNQILLERSEIGASSGS
jgi:hypothetical protein